MNDSNDDKQQPGPPPSQEASTGGPDAAAAAEPTGERQRGTGDARTEQDQAAIRPGWGARADAAVGGGASEQTPGAQAADSLDAEIATLRDQLLRAMAETENLRKRSQRQIEEARKFAVAEFARNLLDVADNLRRALDSVAAEPIEHDGRVANLITGIAAVERTLQDAFAKQGIEKIEPLGAQFDPNYHEAMFEVEHSGQPPGAVVQVLQTGYTLNGRLLRAARVGVAKRSGETTHMVDTTA